MNCQKIRFKKGIVFGILILFFIISVNLSGQERIQSTPTSDMNSAEEKELDSREEIKHNDAVEVKKEKSIKVKPGIEIKQRVDFHVLEGNIQKTQIGRYQDALYERTEFKAKLDIIIDDLTITPWVKERLGGRFNFRDDDPVGDSEDTVNTRFRNRFYTGFAIAYQIDDVSIALENEFRLEADLKDGKASRKLDFRYAPVLIIEGDHDFGLWWGVKQYFAFHFDPKEFTLYDIDGAYELGYTFWEGQGSAGTDLSVSLLTEYEMRWRLDANGSRTRLENEIFSGFKIKSGFVKPFFGYWMWSYDEREGIKDQSDKLYGVKAGMAVQKDKISLGVNYKGGVNLNSVDEGKGWQSAVSTSIKFKF